MTLGVRRALSKEVDIGLSEESRDQMGGDFNTQSAKCPQTSSVMIWDSTVAGESFNFSTSLINESVH